MVNESKQLRARFCSLRNKIHNSRNRPRLYDKDFHLNVFPGEFFDDDFIAFTRLVRKRIHHLVFLKNGENRSSMIVVFQVGNTGKAVNHY